LALPRSAAAEAGRPSGPVGLHPGPYAMHTRAHAECRMLAQLVGTPAPPVGMCVRMRPQSPNSASWAPHPGSAGAKPRRAACGTPLSVPASAYPVLPRSGWSVRSLLMLPKDLDSFVTERTPESAGVRVLVETLAGATGRLGRIQRQHCVALRALGEQVSTHAPPSLRTSRGRAAA